MSMMQPIDYCVALADGLIAPPSNLDVSTVQQQELAPTFRYHIRQYLSRRAADWKALGFAETLVDWPSLNARSKFWGDDGRAAFRNWEEITDPRNPAGRRQGVNERIMTATFCFWILAMPVLGYVVVTLISTFVFAKAVRLEGWRKPLAVAVGTAAFIWLLFDVWLYIDLPRGIWVE